jgi:WD40 repeat protein
MDAGLIGDLVAITSPGDGHLRIWNRGGTRLVSASEMLRIWTKDVELLLKHESTDLLWGVDWRPGGLRIVTSSIDGRVRLWNSDGELVKEIVGRYYGPYPEAG